MFDGSIQEIDEIERKKITTQTLSLRSLVRSGRVSPQTDNHINWSGNEKSSNSGSFLSSSTSWMMIIYLDKFLSALSNNVDSKTSKLASPSLASTLLLLLAIAIISYKLITKSEISS